MNDLFLINEAESVIIRKALILYHTKENEMYAVIRRSKFKNWNEE